MFSLIVPLHIVLLHHDGTSFAADQADTLSFTFRKEIFSFLAGLKLSALAVYFSFFVLVCRFSTDHCSLIDLIAGFLVIKTIVAKSFFSYCL